MVVAVREAGLDHQVPLVAGLAHPAEVAVADPLGAGPVLGTGAVQAVACTEQTLTLSTETNDQSIREQFEVVMLVINNLSAPAVV